jgi:hypothetical protein
MYYRLKIIDNKGRTVKYTRTANRRRFVWNLGTINFLELKSKGYAVYLKVDYGKDKDCFGHTVDFFNDGTYSTRKDLEHAYRAFLEVS